MAFHLVEFFVGHLAVGDGSDTLEDVLDGDLAALVFAGHDRSTVEETEGRSVRIEAIIIPGMFLSQPPMVTSPSMRSPKETSSTESAIISREISEAFIPSVPIEIASEIVIVPNSIGMPPASSIPESAASATSSKWTLHGVMSAAGFGTPIIGAPKSSSSNPIARNIARCGAFSAPSVTSRLRNSSSLP